MTSLWEVYLNGTAIKELPNNIDNLESIWFLDLSNSAKFKNFPDNGGNMKSPMKVHLNNTTIKELPYSIVNLEFVEILISLIAQSLRNFQRTEEHEKFREALFEKYYYY